MFLTNYNGKEYSFHDDHMTIDGVSLDYSKMTDIAHKSGDAPAIVFTYEGQRITMPYDKKDYKSVLPYFIHANKLKPEEEEAEAVIVDQEASAEPDFTYEPEEPQAAAEPDFTYEPEAEEAPAEPDFTYEPEGEEAPVEPEAYAEPEVPAEPEEYAEPEAPAEPEAYAEPEAPAEPEAFAEPEVPAESEAYAEPEVPAEPEASAATGATAQPEKATPKKAAGGLLEGIRSMQRKKLIAIAAVLAAVILAIILAVAFAGNSVEGIDGKVETKSVKTDAGDTIKVTVIDDDVNVDEYALSYYESRFKDGDKVHWIYNKAKGQTILFAEQEGTVLICVYEHVEGDEEDPSLLGAGSLLETWLLYPETGEIIRV